MAKLYGGDALALMCILGGATVGGVATLAMAEDGSAHRHHEVREVHVDAGASECTRIEAERVRVSASGSGHIVVAPGVRIGSGSTCVEVGTVRVRTRVHSSHAVDAETLDRARARAEIAQVRLREARVRMEEARARMEERRWEGNEEARRDFERAVQVMKERLQEMDGRSFDELADLEAELETLGEALGEELGAALGGLGEEISFEVRRALTEEMERAQRDAERARRGSGGGGR